MNIVQTGKNVQNNWVPACLYHGVPFFRKLFFDMPNYAFTHFIGRSYEILENDTKSCLVLEIFTYFSEAFLQSEAVQLLLNFLPKSKATYKKVVCLQNVDTSAAYC